jgi:hypothetical protein
MTFACRRQKHHMGIGAVREEISDIIMKACTNKSHRIKTQKDNITTAMKTSNLTQ